MKTEMRTELFSTRAKADSRTYFFDVKQSQDGTRYLVVSESRHKKGRGYDHHRVMVFEEHLEEFQHAMTQAVDHLQKLRPPTKAYSVEAIRKDYPMAYAKWTPEDDRRLWELRRSGCSVDELSEVFNRNSGAIQSRLRKLAIQAADVGRQSTAGGNEDVVGENGQQSAECEREHADEFDLPF